MEWALAHSRKDSPSDSWLGTSSGFLLAKWEWKTFTASWSNHIIFHSSVSDKLKILPVSILCCPSYTAACPEMWLTYAACLAARDTLFSPFEALLKLLFPVKLSAKVLIEISLFIHWHFSQGHYIRETMKCLYPENAHVSLVNTEAHTAPSRKEVSRLVKKRLFYLPLPFERIDLIKPKVLFVAPTVVSGCP